ncbi:MAG: Anti-sigma-28 factor, FlgM [Symbiobacteriaceae bacterium]|jgi:negative regulator of flagellin synthesis FlgM|nr:Anti-sigma-28 factor, FlgM [Symbiobacteriaceae bacterium]
MKINNVPGAMGVYQKSGVRRVTGSQEASRPTKGDGVVLSKEAQQALALKDKVSQAPEVRQQRIEELRRQIESGTYKPDARQVADKLLKTRVLDELI